ncbi:hypothetical protein PHLGIDRAFT_495821 [Phlebiopsis gigantea 11061_1 CR5-6]|uniref:Uncharacterized protein n=1 Tax=Phlebiopsis gigantea (strain 11061_1 CR5-6) TaxID=745531 RepID=A0A0C3S2C3_PHLG1|nr:hypothetical protein PHLGIDRAFT_495821 [Phlebiopsis gigantea 11061_1 CR5-6]
MEPGTRSLEEMANAIEPIIDRFDEVLRQPYLKNYSATLNTVPVVGLRGREIMYINTTSSVTSPDGLAYEWASFSAIPTNANLASGNAVHFFPYRGDFYLSVGRAVWRKAHISDRDESALAQAVNNWPGMYVKDWTHVGNTALPAANLAGVVPFAMLSADSQQIGFQLVTLASDGTLSYLTNSTLVDNSTFARLEYRTSSGSPSTAPRFTKVAYWDNQIVGVDNANNTWNITPNWSGHTYTVSTQTPITPVTEFTANDAGLVGLRSDGYLWRRVIQPPPPGSSNDASLTWLRWIRVDGVANLGVASPGVLLDMNLLTRTLRSRYVEVQVSVYPVMNMLRAWGLTHQVFLRNVAADADAWQNASTEEARRLAIQNAQAFVSHSQTWSTIVSRSISGAQDGVNLMTLQLREVRNDLEEQLVLLRDKLVALQATLSAQQETLSTLKAALWGSIAATLFGVALAIAGLVFAQPWLIYGGGFLFAAGLISTVALAVYVAQLAASIADTQAQIRDVNTAIIELGTIVKSFTELDYLYGTLNQYWGRMANDASAIRAMDSATAAQIGAEILADKSSIQASQAMVVQMTNACQTYLDVLNRQGITIPVGSSLASAPSDIALLSHKDQVDALLVEAGRAIRARDEAAYEKLMKRATAAHAELLADTQRAIVASGQWFDVPALRLSSSIWQNYHSFTRSVDLPPAFRSSSDQTERSIARSADNMDGILNELRPEIEGALRDIIALGDIIHGWTSRFPVQPTDSAGIAEFERYQREAIAVCQQAQRKAAIANNRFADFTNEARQYQTRLDQKIRETQDAITREQRRAQEDLNNITVPWYIYLAGLLPVIAWRENEKAAINRRLAATVNRLNADIAEYRKLQSSGHTFEGHALSWIKMTQTVSGNLGGIYNLLTGVWGLLISDPIAYSEFLRVEWNRVVSDAHDVLHILGSRPLTLTLDDPSLPATPVTDRIMEKALVIAAVSPDAELARGIEAQAVSADDVFTRLRELLWQPYLRDIVGFWTEGDTERNTLFDVVTNLRTEYVQMIATQYNSIESLYALSILQGFRAQNVANGALSLELFVFFTTQSVRTALKAAENTSALHGDAAQQFEYILAVIDKNIEEINEMIGDLDDKIDEANAALRDKIINLVASTIALAFAAAGVLVAFGVVGPVAAAVTAAAQIGASATATAATIKVVLDSLSLADLVQTIEGLKATRKVLQDSVNQLETVRPYFAGVVDGANGLTRNVKSMSDLLEDILVQTELLNEVSLTSEDALGIKASWDHVQRATLAWLDVVNKQGISPITFSINQKVQKN